MDPWVITPQERERHMQQFNTVNPENGFITGNQAKGYFMQSGLPPMVLAQIWGLSDMNGDGKMDLNEFSVACKLINLKLKGMELPKTLPPQMLNQGGMNQMMPGMGMPGMMGGQPGMPGMMNPGMQGMMPGMGMMNQGMGMGMPGQNMMGMGMPGMGMPGMGMGGMQGGMGMPGMGGMQGGMGMGGMQGGMGMGGMQGGMPGMMGGQGMMGGMMGGQAYPQQGMGMSMSRPGSRPPTRPGSAMGSPTPPVEWAIPQTKRVAYSAQFQANDKARTGFLAAVQARGLLLQTGLSQQTLATVWNQSDIDKDGKLSLEEFILAMHLCDLGMKGEPIPQPLPVNLIPPGLRQRAAANASSAVSTPTSNKPAAGAGHQEEPLSPASFEDKRKENWESGQAELQKRRASLMEQQQKDKAEREKKEKEEAEKRLADERQRLEEIHRLKKQQEEEREHARKELEKQRMEEWERKRKEELENHRKREQERVFELKAQKDTLVAQLEDQKTKMENLTTGITETRAGVTDVKQFIDGMRTARDTKMAELNALKNQLKEQNTRLMQVTQEKAKIESKNKVNQLKLEEGRDVEFTDFDLKKEEKMEKVVALRNQMNILQEEEGVKKAEVDTNKKILMEHRERLMQMIETCKALHEGFDEKRLEVRAEKQKKIRELTDPNHAWDKPKSFSPDFDDFEDMTAPAAAGDIGSAAPPTRAGYLQYRAVYDYEARNEDELSFQTNDIILVHPEQEHEPGWLGGELNGKIGWFPETYAEQLGDNGQPVATAAEPSLQTIAEVSETSSDKGSLQDQGILQDAGAEQLSSEAAEAPTAEVAVAETAAAVAETIASPPAVISQVETAAADWSQPAVADDWSQPAAAADWSQPAAASEPVSAEAAPSAVEEQAAVPTTTAALSEELSEEFVALYAYQSGEPGDLIFEAGERIMVTRKEGEWWTGRIQDRTGVFPFNYVDVPSAVDASLEIEGQDSLQQTAEQNAAVAQIIAEDKSGKKMEIAKVIASYERTSKEQLSLQQGQMVIVRKRTESGWWQGEVGKGKKREVGWFPASYVTLLEGVGGGGASAAGGAAQGQEAEKKSSGVEQGDYFTAVYDYTGQYEDELSFKAGDQLLVTNTDDANWWQGTLGDKSGVFPSNYVEKTQ